MAFSPSSGLDALRPCCKRIEDTHPVTISLLEDAGDMGQPSIQTNPPADAV
jgi:hypothetical protein